MKLLRNFITVTDDNFQRLTTPIIRSNITQALNNAFDALVPSNHWLTHIHARETKQRTCGAHTFLFSHFSINFEMEERSRKKFNSLAYSKWYFSLVLARVFVCVNHKMNRRFFSLSFYSVLIQQWHSNLKCIKIYWFFSFSSQIDVKYFPRR